jgi:hypothetical protein
MLVWRAMGTRELLRIGVGGLVVLIAGLLVGCGGGGDSTSSTPLTRQEFLKQGNALCDKRLEERDASVVTAYEENIAEYERLPKAGQEKLAGEVALEVDLPIYRKLVHQLGELTPPAKEAKAVEEMLSNYEALLDELFENPEKLHEAEPLAPNAEAVHVGLVGCNL